MARRLSKVVSIAEVLPAAKRRLSLLVVNAEQRRSVTYRRVSKIVAGVEGRQTVTFRRLSAMRVMVEWRRPKLGPEVQVI